MNGCTADLGTLEEFPTADGSFSLRSGHFGEAFHNSLGALNEAKAKFSLPAQLHRFRGLPLSVLDVCLGLGYNSAVVLEDRPEPAPQLQWWGLELDRRPLELALKRSDFQRLWKPAVLQRLEAIRDRDGWSSSDGKGTMLWGDARQTLAHIPSDRRFDLILLDAFSPGRCPELWSEEFLHALAARLAPGGRLLTYSRAAAIRASLRRAGLDLFSLLPAPGERPGWSSGTLAVQPGIKPISDNGPGWRAFSQMEEEHLQTRAAIPFRDPCGTDSNGTILQRRCDEQHRCSLEATNAWQRRWAHNRSKQRIDHHSCSDLNTEH